MALSLARALPAGREETSTLGRVLPIITRHAYHFFSPERLTLSGSAAYRQQADLKIQASKVTP